MGLIYKREQGRWVRIVALAALLALGLWGLAEFSQAPLNPKWLAYTLGAVMLVAAVVGAVYVNMVPKAADLLIETEGEMKKVTWPSWSEVVSATGVVILVVAVTVIYIFSVDVVVSRFFKAIRWVVQYVGGA
jgi:preprotein translocase SecE subunit